MEIGKITEFEVTEINNSGYLLGTDDSDELVFLPPALSEEKLEIGDRLKAFPYVDHTGGVIATTKLPLAEVNQYACLKAINVQDFGAFFDWGIEKDLLVPGNQQKFKVQKNEYHIVRICREDETERLYGTTKLGKFIEETVFDIQEKDKVSVIPVVKSDWGYRVIIDQKYIGMIYYNEIFCDIHVGQTYDGYVKKIREDKLVDVALQVQGVDNLYQAKQKILKIIKENNGTSSVTDKSPPEIIKQSFGMSKQTFKKAVGMLYKDRQIIINKNQIKIRN